MRGSISRTAPSFRRFEPFELKIQVETEADLASLWTRFNMSGQVLANAAQNKARTSRLGSFCGEFIGKIDRDPVGKKTVWKLLHEELKKAGIRRR
jgi:hypothetical protein